MIDEAVLEGLVREAGDAVACPPGGAAHIRLAQAEREPARANRRPAVKGGRNITRPGRSMPGRRVRVLALAGVAVVIAATVSGLALAGSGSHSTASESGVPLKAPTTAAGAASGSTASLTPFSPAQNSTFSGAGTGASARGLSGSPSEPGNIPAAAPASAPPTSPNVVPQLPSRVIKTGTLSVRLKAGGLQPAVGQLMGDAAALGGYVASSSTSAASPGVPANGTVTLSVPVGSFETLVGEAEKVGAVQSVTTSGQDVTAAYVDLQARIQSLDDARTQYEQILAKAVTIGDILSVESQIDDVQTQMDQLQGQLDVMTKETTFSNLTVQLTEVSVTPPPPKPPKPPKPPSGLSKAWHHAIGSFAHGTEAVLGSLGGTAVFLLVVAVGLAIVRLGWVAARRRMV